MTFVRGQRHSLITTRWKVRLFYSESKNTRDRKMKSALKPIETALNFQSISNLVFKCLKTVGFQQSQVLLKKTQGEMDLIKWSTAQIYADCLNTWITVQDTNHYMKIEHHLHVSSTYLCYTGDQWRQARTELCQAASGEESLR